MLAKAAGLAPDQVVLDLEDAVAARREDRRDPRAGGGGARGGGLGRADALGTRERRRHPVVPRRRGADRAASRRPLHSVVVPKVESADDARRRRGRCWTSSRPSSGSARSGSRRRSRARAASSTSTGSPAASPRLEALIFGPGDYAASLGIPQREIGADRPRLPGRPVALRALADRGRGARATGSIRSTARTPPSATWTGSRETARRRAAPRLRRQVGDPSGPDRDRATGLLAVGGRDRRAPSGCSARSTTPPRDGRAALELDGAMIDEASRQLAEAVLAARGRGARAVMDAPLARPPRSSRSSSSARGRGARFSSPTSAPR